MTASKNIDVLIVGAGAAGLMCAIEAAKRGRDVIVIEKSKKLAGKIFISGGGRCNFTNLHSHPNCYLSNNTHFCKSALSRYSHWDFIAFVEKHGLSWHEKESKNVAGYISENNQGQLFCDQKSQAIIDALVAECDDLGVVIYTQTEVLQLIKCDDNKFEVRLSQSDSVIYCMSFVVATGGPSIPKMGATDFAINIAKQFNLSYFPFVPALVPLTLSQTMRESLCYELAGVSLWVEVSAKHDVYGTNRFKENLLITHKGLSGPAILQISSYWQQGKSININLLPEHDAIDLLTEAKDNAPNKMLSSTLKPHWPTKWLVNWLEKNGGDVKLQALSIKRINELANAIHDWQLLPAGTEGMAKAEVSSGGVDCNELSSQTLMTRNINGLYFIGEAVDVTGFLGGYNFQWAWSSGWCAGQVV